jgi:CRP/FNR family cyclic AMP-dependent transcriptional regulator
MRLSVAFDATCTSAATPRPQRTRSEDALVPFLHHVPLCAGLDEDVLRQIARVARVHTYKKASTIIQADDPGYAFYILKRGLLKMTLDSSQGAALILHLVYPGECFGDIAVLDEVPQPATVVAQEASDVVRIPRAPFRELLDQCPPLVRRLTAVLSQRLRQATALLQSLAFCDVYGKVAWVLLTLAAKTGRVTAQGTVIDLHLTRQEFAALAGITPASLIRTLRALQQAGCVHLGGARQITVVNPERLRREIRRTCACAAPGSILGPH